MTKLHTEELVYTETEDGVLLEGAVIRPADVAVKPVALVWVHGLTGKFYGPTIVRIGREVAGHGFAFVTGNNRGHDFGCVLRRRATAAPALGGGGWELFDESPHDLAAWVGFTVGLGFRGVVLIGHSLGAHKVGYYQALRQDPRVAGVVFASPPTRVARVPDPDLLALAERMVAEGRGQDLLPWGISPAGAGTVSARTYLSRLKDGLDVFGFRAPEAALVAQIRCPILAFYGTEEAWVGTAADLELLRQHARTVPRVDTRLFEGADHSYAGHEPEVAAALAGWVGQLL